MWRHMKSSSLCSQIVKLNNAQRLYSDARPVMAIRREDVNVWERRAPLSPAHVRKLVKKGVKVIVQLSNRRAYPMQDYAKQGAIVQEDLSEASFIIGVKQVPIDTLMPNKTYAFFSHTIKAQEANMPLLDALLEKNIRLIDYEKMVDNTGQRVVAFGKYAGVAGMINILHGLGLRLLALGHHTSFMNIGPSHNYRNSEQARRAIRDAGYEISLGRLPKSLGPLTFVFTGSGNVSQGAQEVFQELPHEYIEPEHLPKVVTQGATNKLYACVVSREDHYIRKDGGKFNADEFEQHPERYLSTFSKSVAPYASVLINGIYWAPNAPRLITIPDAKSLLGPVPTPWIPSSVGCPQLPHRLIALCDISADPGGSIEFMKECTTIDKPFCLYDAEQNMNTESFSGNGVLICSIDNMPAQIPTEATDYFGNLLLPHVYDMLKSDATKPFDEYDASPIVKNSVITSNGKLTPNFEYISDMRKKQRSQHKAQLSAQASHKKVLILGAGYVSSPVIEYLCRDQNVHVTVVSPLQEELNRSSAVSDNVEPVMMDISRHSEDLEQLVPNHDIVVSLLPYTMHPDIAKMCIRHGKNMVTASYLTPTMQELHQAAFDADVTMMMEVGVDPGIDHMLAMECFDEVKQAGGKVESYVSWCGGLPAPEDSETPLKYKFSWSPLSVLVNTLSNAKYLRDGKVVEIPAGGALLDNTEELKFLPGFNLEGFPNRDSTSYLKSYNIESAHTLLRGTIRYKGFSDIVKGLVMVGLIDEQAYPFLHSQGPDLTWKNLMCELVGSSQDILADSLKDIMFEKVGCCPAKLKCIIDLDLLGDELVDKKGTPIDTLSNYLSKRLAFGPGERDIIIMRHEVGVRWADGSHETRHIGLIMYGDVDGDTAMAKTVGFPTGIATKMVLEGEIQTKGVVRPFSSDIYRPILKRLKHEGIYSREHVTKE